MQLTFSEIQSITTGAVRMTEEADGIHFYRFTAQQEEFYQKRKEEFYQKTFAASGVTLRFRTDSQKLSLAAEISRLVPRCYYAIEVQVSGQRIGSINNFEGQELPLNYPTAQLELGPVQKEFDLGPGLKEVRILLPWIVKTVLKSVCLDDGAVLEPIKPQKKLLCFGDSITQGYDALYPSRKYTTQLADFLGAEEFNKAIGGEIFVPGLAELGDDLEPDYITVAYGTNDWSAMGREYVEKSSREFYCKLRKTYPNAPIYAITPIWRGDKDMEKPVGPFSDVPKIIAAAIEGLPNVKLVNGYEFVPQDTRYFADQRLHPNDSGFCQYAENLKKYF